MFGSPEVLPRKFQSAALAIGSRTEEARQFGISDSAFESSTYFDLRTLESRVHAKM
jgi:hypothetical protein